MNISFESMPSFSMSLITTMSVRMRSDCSKRLPIGCIEEIAYRMGFIDAEKLRFLGEKYIKSGYGEYLLKILEQKQL